MGREPCIAAGLLAALLCVGCKDDPVTPDPQEATPPDDPAADAASTTGPTEPTTSPTGPHSSWTDGLTSALRTEGLSGATLEEGGFLYRTLDDCEALLAEVGTCYGLHPASPYLLFDFDDPGDPIDALATYQLAQDEALLYVGHTPPQARYFSFNHYQYLKYVPGAEEPHQLTFGSMAPSLSMLGITTAPSPTAPYDAYTVVLATANATTAARVTEGLVPLLEAHGFDPSIVNVHPIAYADADDAQRLRDGQVVRGAGPLAPDDVFELTMGRGPEADWYTMAVRVAAADDPDHPYLSEATIPAAVFRVRMDEPVPYDPFPFPSLPPDRETDQHQGGVAEALTHAADALGARLRAEGKSTARIPQVHRFPRTGPDCINQTLPFCAANNDDAHYIRTAADLAIPDLEDPDSAVYVIGVLHKDVAAAGGTEAPPISYSSITVVNLRWFYGVVSVLDVDLAGSLRAVFPDGVPGMAPGYEDVITIQQFARPGHCDPVVPCVEIGVGPLGVAADETFDIMERIYMNESTGTAPSEDSVEPGLVIVTGPNIHWDPELNAIALNGPVSP